MTFSTTSGPSASGVTFQLPETYDKHVGSLTYGQAVQESLEMLRELGSDTILQLRILIAQTRVLLW